MAELIRKDIFTAPLAVHADETTWPVLGRKNFYASKTINGADVAATLYTIIESCKRVELDVTTFTREIIRRNNHDEAIITPLKYATEIRKPAAA